MQVFCSRLAHAKILLLLFFFFFPLPQVNQWCESGIYLLASQAVDKCQSQEGAESALTDIERFLESAEKNQLNELRNLHNQYEVVLSEDLKVPREEAAAAGESTGRSGRLSGDVCVCRPAC